MPIQDATRRRQPASPSTTRTTSGDIFRFRIPKSRLDPKKEECSMAAPTMTGAEFAGRVFAIEALVIALAAEMLASHPEDKVQALFAGVQDLKQGVIDDLTP